MGGVYKLAGIEIDGVLQPKMKMSDTPAKITNPGYKKIVRLYDKNTDKAIADLIALQEENFDGLEELEIFHPDFAWKRKKVTGFYTKELGRQIIKDGKLVYKLPSVMEIAAYHKQSYGEFWNEYKRMLNPHIYKVDLSQKLYDLKQKLIKENKKS